MATKVKQSVSNSASTNGELSAAPLMQPTLVTFRIVGVSPLLQNNPAEFIGKDEAVDDLGKKKVYVDADEAEKRCYRDTSGNYCHPAEAFLKAMIKAVTGLKFGKKSAPGCLKGSVFIAEPFCVIEDAKGRPATNYTIDRRSVVVGPARVLRCRPCWYPWEMSLVVEMDASFISESQIRQALLLAGRKIGIGDARAEKSPAGFGRFAVK